MSQRQFVVIGLNHKTAPVELRERFTVSSSKLPALLSAFTDSTGLASCVCLSTCNRTELYTLLPSLDGELERVKSFLAEYHKVERDQFDNALYVHPGERGVEHLFKVASGLDSLVLGESEILGQVKQAYLTAQAHRKVEKALHLLFQRSLRVAKKVRTETGIGRGLCSVGSVAVLLAEKIFGNLSRRTIMVIGAGKMGELTARHLLKEGVNSILVSNRSFTRACMSRTCTVRRQPSAPGRIAPGWETAMVQCCVSARRRTVVPPVSPPVATSRSVGPPKR